MNSKQHGKSKCIPLKDLRAMWEASWKEADEWASQDDLMDYWINNYSPMAEEYISRLRVAFERKLRAWELEVEK